MEQWVELRRIIQNMKNGGINSFHVNAVIHPNVIIEPHKTENAQLARIVMATAVR